MSYNGNAVEELVIKKLKKLNTSLVSRQFFALKKGIGLAPSLFRNLPAEELILKVIGKNHEKFVEDINMMKGSFVKAAQMLSLYGEHFLPSEVRDFISQLQSQGHYLDWEQMSPLIHQDIQNKLEISESPLAAASIGQVHRARYCDKEVVLKIQYRGIRDAIDLDLKLLKFLISSLKVLPKKINLDPIYQEIRENLIMEMDYKRELSVQQKFKELLDEPGIYVPEVYPEISDNMVLASEFCQGTLLSSQQVRKLDQEIKNSIAIRIFKLFFYELFHFNLIQTDAHPGNYLYDKDKDRLVIIDFGSVRGFDEQAINHYQRMIKSFYHGSKDDFLQVFHEMIEMNKSEVEINEDELWEYCFFITKPIRENNFDWASTEHANKVFELAQRTLKNSKVKTPPNQFLFIDRKVVGLFFLMKTLDAKFNAREIVGEFLD